MVLLCVASSVFAYESKMDSIMEAMKPLAERYEQTHFYTHKKSLCDSLVEAMERLNFEMMRDYGLMEADRIDLDNYTGVDFRHLGVAMHASGLTDAAMWYYIEGAKKGDPYCCNAVYVESMLELQDPDECLGILNMSEGVYTVPFAHNFALGFLKSSHPELQEQAKNFAEFFFLMYDGVTGKGNIGEYIIYDDSEEARATGRVWRHPTSFAEVGRYLKAWYDTVAQ